MTDVFASKQFNDTPWALLVEPPEYVACEPILRTYCDLVQVEIVTAETTEKKTILKVDFERNAFGVYKPDDMF